MHEVRQKIQKMRQQDKDNAIAEEEKDKKAFYDKLEKSKDLNDNLPDLVDFLQKYTGATGVYLGRLQHPDKKIAIDADDKAHFDYDAPKVVKFIHSSKSHEFMEGAVLPPNVGVTHDVFNQDKYSRLEESRVIA